MLNPKEIFISLSPRHQRTSGPGGLKEKEQRFLDALRSLSTKQYLLFLVGWMAWTCDAMDFFSVSLSVPSLSETFGKSTSQITSAITLTLLFRSLGAFIFGMLSDRFGRKWPLIINLLICAVFELAAGFARSYSTFLVLRSLFGVAMGGIWGIASSTSLESLPPVLRGLGSGIVQQGYAVGYLLAAAINLSLVEDLDDRAAARGGGGGWLREGEAWRSLFFVAAGVSAGVALFRVFLPESEVFLRAKERQGVDVVKDGEKGEVEGEERKGETQKTSTFVRETGRMMKLHWKRWIYAVLLMSGFNFLSHGSQDLYPTYLQVTKGFSRHSSSIATIIGNCGAIVGGMLAGALSQFIGRRLTIILFILLVGAFIPLWILPSRFPGLSAGAFFVQLGVQGAWGVIPIFLAELSPPAFRALFGGLSYQLGNMVSASSAQIEATAGTHLRTTIGGKDVPDYATVQGIFIGCVAAFTIVMVLIGPENRGAHFEQHRAAFEERGGLDSDPELGRDLEGDQVVVSGVKKSESDGSDLVEKGKDEKKEVVIDEKVEKEERKEVA